MQCSTRVTGRFAVCEGVVAEESKRDVGGILGGGCGKRYSLASAGAVGPAAGVQARADSGGLVTEGGAAGADQD